MHIRKLIGPSCSMRARRRAVKESFLISKSAEIAIAGRLCPRGRLWAMGVDRKTSPLHAQTFPAAGWYDPTRRLEAERSRQFEGATSIQRSELRWLGAEP